MEDKSLSTKYKKETIESQEILNLFKKSVFLFSNALFLLSPFPFLSFRSLATQGLVF